MLTIYVARHGQDKDNEAGILNGRRDMPLTLKGIYQAMELAKNIKVAAIRFQHMYSSPLQRAYKTAKIIAKILHFKKPETLDDLIERDFGVMTGESVGSIKEYCSPDIIQTERICYFLNPAGAETFTQLLVRGGKVLDTIKTSHQNGNILLVAHGDIGKMIYASYYNLDWLEVLTKFHFGNAELLRLSSEHGPEEAHIFKTEQHNG